ncbi:MAG: DUF4129 domain-containing protein [Cyclobacteriaceae bacterium]|jgi:hypothetical protein|nr:DUF4129 domain-containing protein [Cyclobacteriaceae bacterium]
MGKFVFIFFVWLFFSVFNYQSAHAQEEATDSVDYSYYEEEESYTVVEPQQTEQARQYNSETVTIKKFDEAKWKEVIADETFVEQKPKEERKRNNFDPDLSALSPALQIVLKIIGYIAIGFILAGIVYLIIKNTTTSTGTAKRKSDLFDTITKAIDDINLVDLDQWLKQALENGNLKAAIRVYFLITLRNLQQAGLVKYQKDKTNRDYIFEMANKPHAEQFRKATQTYEWVWYGDQEIDKEQFDVFQTTFVNINNQVTGNTHATA